MAQPELTGYREAWLQAAASFLFDHIAAHDLPRMNVRVSCGWPVRGGVARRRTVIGQCSRPRSARMALPKSSSLPASLIVWMSSVRFSMNFYMPRSAANMDTINRSPRRAHKFGLGGPPTATVVGENLRPLLLSYVERVGLYPHAAITVKSKEKVGSRLRLYQCRCNPPVKVRVASDTFEAVCLNCDEDSTQVVKDDELSAVL